MNFDHRVDVETTAEELWPLLADDQHMMRWSPDIVSVETTTSGPPGVGTRSAVQIREGSRVVDYDSEILTFEPCTCLRIQLTGGSLGASPMVVTYSITPRQDRIELTYSARWRAVGLMLRLLAPVITIMAKRNARAAMDRLKRLAEGEPP